MGSWNRGGITYFNFSLEAYFANLPYFFLQMLQLQYSKVCL